MIVATCVAHPTRMLTLPLVSVVTEVEPQEGTSRITS
jgi:hypothetical protein